MFMASSHNMAIAGMFGRPSEAAINMLNNQVNEMQHSNLYQQMQGFFQQSVERVQDLTTGETARKIQALYNKTNALFQENDISAMIDIGEIQQAPDVMLRYIMCQPDIRRMYLDGEINGYEGRYECQHHNDGVGHDQHDYRVSVDGMVMQRQNEEGEQETYMRHYFEAPTENAKLTHHQKAKIRQTHENLEWMIQNDVQDPTSEWAELL